MDERPEALLKSALEKIVYFEARSQQLENDLGAVRAEADRLRSDISGAAQREIELRRLVAELEVRAVRAHAEREDSARVVEALRRERAELIGKMLEASRIHRADAAPDPDSFDLARFISELRGEVLVKRPAGSATAHPGSEHAPTGRSASGHTGTTSHSASGHAAATGHFASEHTGTTGHSAAEHAAATGHFAAEHAAATGHFAAEHAAATGHPERRPQAVVEGPDHAALRRAHAVAESDDSAAGERSSAVTSMASELKAQGRLELKSEHYAALSVGQAFAGRTEETLFGFSVRELSAPDSQSRIRAADRLKALGHPAAAPALAAALHHETDPSVLVALLASFSHFAKEQGAPVVTPLLSSPFPDVRINALKALGVLDPSRAGPHLTAAMSDPDRVVRRRASLLALSLTGDAALRLGEKAIGDSDPQVRALAALVLGASGAEAARPSLFRAMRDPEEKVRKAAAESLSKLLGRDVSQVVGLEDAPRRRAVRQLAQLPNQAAQASLSARSAAVGVKTSRVAVVEAPAPLARVDEALCGAVLVDLRSALRGRTLAELQQSLSRAEETTLLAVGLLEGRGQVVKRGHKYFVA